MNAAIKNNESANLSALTKPASYSSVRAFTLLEAIIALALMIALLSGVYGFYANSLKARHDGGKVARDVMLMRAKAIDVDTVLVNGKVVLQSGLPTGFDLPAVGQEIAVQLDNAPNPDLYRVLAAELKPYLSNWYAQWETPLLSPYVAFNSRI